ncbi:MAG: ABC transporter ATP-binding protein [Bacillota bacterium]|jgi:NitT/TauT family transport system ATP-binding protein
MTEPIIIINNVTSAYTTIDTPELREATLTINAGELVSLVGPSGCGKSTLLRLIAGVLTPVSGNITIGSAGAATELTGWAKLSFVPQDSLLLPWRTVLANVSLPLELQARFSQAQLRQKALAALELVNLTGYEAKYPAELSGGMRQRVALARALVGRAQILLLDEPFAALDDLTRSQLHLELLRIQAQTGITILLVTHNIFEAVFLSHRVVVMGEKPGRILGEIPISLPQPRQRKMVGTPAFGAAVGQVQDLLTEGWAGFNGQ